MLSFCVGVLTALRLFQSPEPPGSIKSEEEIRVLDTAEVATRSQAASKFYQVFFGS